MERNVTFYIYSINGALIYNYLGNRSAVEKESGRTVLFPSGSEFLVCKVEMEGQGANAQYKIYLRNITLGLTQNQLILWTDDQSVFKAGHRNKFENVQLMLNYRT